MKSCMDEELQGWSGWLRGASMWCMDKVEAVWGGGRLWWYLWSLLAGCERGAAGPKGEGRACCHGRVWQGARWPGVVRNSLEAR